MILNDAGKMVVKWYYELENKFPDIRCHAMTVMPDHFHCIIEIVRVNPAAGADLRVCPDTKMNARPYPENKNTNPAISDDWGEHVNPAISDDWGEHVNADNRGEHAGSPLCRVVQWFKTMTTNEYIRGVKKFRWPPFNGKLWQRNYYEHIIRNRQSYENISKYIHNNPANWKANKNK